MININPYGTANVFSWTKEYLLSVLIGGKSPILKDPLLINAFRTVDRKDFIPEKLSNMAYGDYEVDIGYSEKLNKPTIVAQMLSYLAPKYGGKYLDVGTGTGYTAAVLGFCAGDSGKVYSLERVQWIFENARTNMKKYPSIKNLEIIYRDGTEGLIQKAPFDGIHIAFADDSIANKLKTQLKTDGGILVHPTIDNNLKIIKRNSVEDFTEEVVSGFIFDKSKAGTA
ncbi:MAG: protein-L-isoaspartate O-methyltransferase family protein [Candidatus Dojkabacteria bacterium]